MIRPLRYLVLLLVTWVGALEAQTGIPERGPDLRPGLQPALEAAAARFARVWAQGDAAAIGALVAPGGARLHLDETSHGALSSRQMVAALESFLEGCRTLEVEVVRVSEVGGDPARGFAEVGWKGVRGGTVEEVEYTVYVGFVVEGGDWRVTEVRVIR